MPPPLDPAFAPPPGDELPPGAHPLDALAALLLDLAERQAEAPAADNTPER